MRLRVVFGLALLAGCASFGTATPSDPDASVPDASDDSPVADANRVADAAVDADPCSTVLVGSNKEGLLPDSVARSNTDAYGYVPPCSGVATTAWVHFGNQVDQATLGVYDNLSARPNVLRAQATFTGSGPGWASAKLTPAIQVEHGVVLWLALASSAAVAAMDERNNCLDGGADLVLFLHSVKQPVPSPFPADVPGDPRYCNASFHLAR
jgi:hypothetical protein